MLLLKYKANFSIVLLADAHANYCFQVTDVGEPVARGVILVDSVNLPLDRDSNRDTWEFHYPSLFLELKSWCTFVSDETFLLRVNMLRAFSKHHARIPLLFKILANQDTSDSTIGILAS